jgi:hypothetical protein
MKPKPLITFKNAKTVKGEKEGFLTGILYLAPANVSGVLNVCPKATAGCKGSCLFTAGQGVYRNVQSARIRRTVMYKNERDIFLAQIQSELIDARKKAIKLGLELVIRPNGTSDLPFLGKFVAENNPDLKVYDYTKIPRPWERVMPNYDLTFSRSENNTLDCLRALENGINVAVVFSTKKGLPLPEKFFNHEVIDGDLNDLRFLDKKGVVVGLHAKGRAKHDRTGFVVQV